MKNTQLSVETLEGRLALKLTSALSESTNQLPHDISERLRTARETALRARRPELVPVMTWQGLGNGSSASLQLGGSRKQPRWSRLAAVLPVLVMCAGLYFIQHANTQAQVSAAADVDTVLLADDLPPDVYSDAGFLEFLKAPPQ